MVDFFQNIVDFLNKEEIPYMLTGSVAMSIYVVPRATRDMDFIVMLQAKDIDKIAAHYSKGYYCDKDAMMDALRRKSMFKL